MERFAALYEALDRTTSTNAKVAAIVAYLRAAPPGDAAWALFFLTGQRLTRLLPTRLLHGWTLELTALPEFLVEESYGAVGDFAEAIALLVEGRVTPLSPDDLRARGRIARGPEQGLLFECEDAAPVSTEVRGISLQSWIEDRILPLRNASDEERRISVMTWWSRMEPLPLFVLNKLLTGEMRVGVSRTLVIRAVAELTALPRATIEHRLMGTWEPSAQAFEALILPEGITEQPSHPYPFCLASPLAMPVESLGSRDEWLAEWKWDGIRAQVIHRSRAVFLWTRGEELVTDRFPEIARAAAHLPDGTVLDGELLAFGDGVPRPFADLQRRIGRDRSVAEIAANVPVVFVAFDLLEHGSADIRALPLSERRDRLASLLSGTSAAAHDRGSAGFPLLLSEALAVPDWDGLALLRDESRRHQVEGVMLKRWTSPYRPGRRKGDWWKWKIEPHTVDAVLIYAQPGSGRRATLFTDYTFGVWHQGELVPVAKAYSGLSDDEIDELDRWIRRHTIERFGPVSAVEPVHVFELGFERIARSSRHRSGVALRFPRMLRWRRDKGPDAADTLDTLLSLIRDAEGG